MQPKGTTPGPWKVEGGPRVYSRVVPEGEPAETKRRMVANCDSMLRSRAKADAANARLISAAPDLYAALKALTDALNSKFVHVEATKQMASQLEAAEAQARAALAKATGEST